MESINSAEAYALQAEAEAAEDEEAISTTSTDLEQELDLELDYKTISDPTKYAMFFVLFVFVPSSVGWYFYGGGRNKVRAWRSGSGSGAALGGYGKLKSEA